MVRQSFVAAVVVAIGLSRDPGCGDGEHPSGGANAPCTRNKDCNTGLVCSQGVCSNPDAGPPGDGGVPEASGPSDASNDGG